MNKIMLNGENYGMQVKISNPADFNNNKTPDGTWFGKTRYRRSFAVPITQNGQLITAFPSDEIIVGCDCFFYGGENGSVGGITTGTVNIATQWSATLHLSPQSELLLYCGGALISPDGKAYVTVYSIEKD